MYAKIYENIYSSLRLQAIKQNSCAVYVFLNKKKEENLKRTRAWATEKSVHKMKGKKVCNPMQCVSIARGSFIF